MKAIIWILRGGSSQLRMCREFFRDARTKRATAIVAHNYNGFGGGYDLPKWRRRARRSIAKTRDNMVLSEPRRSECIDCTRAVKEDLEKRRARGKRYYAEHREERCAAQRAYDRLRPSAKGNCVMLKLSGSTLLIGQPGAFQLYVADELAFQHARTGATVVYIAETDRAERAVFDRLDAWTLAKKVARDIPIRRLTGARSWQKADDVLEALRLAEIMGPALLVRDLSGEQALHPNSPWLTMARRLMPHTVLTVANWGGTPRPPNLADYDATLVLECRVGQRFGVSLLTGAEVVQEYQQYQGREVQSTVIFDPVAPTAAQPQGHHR
jgi:hypothetical protein